MQRSKRPLPTKRRADTPPAPFNPHHPTAKTEREIIRGNKDKPRLVRDPDWVELDRNL